MKKNAMLKIAAILMVAVLLTTCAISSTFAKYTTSKSYNGDDARIAKWGVELTVSSDELFKQTYGSETAAYTGNSVAALTSGDLLVAPGTSGSINAISTVTGTPEVAVKVTTQATLTLTGWSYKLDGDDNATPYCPLVFTVGTETYYIGKELGDGSKITSTDALITAVEEAIESGAEEYFDANTDLSTVDSFGIKFGWSWAFDEATTTLTGYQTNVQDTYLGNMADAGQQTLIKLEYTQSIEQIN